MNCLKLGNVIEYTIEHPDNPEEQLTYRLITSLLDIERFPAELLAREYHQRWEVENTSDIFLFPEILFRNVKDRQFELFG